MEAVFSGFATLLEPAVLAFLLLGIVAGLIVGAIPGLNDNIALAIFIPFTFSLTPIYGLALMVGLYCSCAIGGSIPAIMVKVPGTASAILTTIDGNAMARAGRPGQAIGIAITSSVVGGFSSALVLVFLAPPLAKFALQFGYVENFALGVLGLASVIGLLGTNVLKGLIAAAVGLLVATVGLSLETGFPRFTYGVANLYEGVPFVPLLVGLFGVTSALELAEELVRERRAGAGISELPRITDRLVLDKAMVRRLLPTWAQCSVIGNVVGVIPGAGMIMAIFLAYERISRQYKKKYEGRAGEPKWGEGAPEGIAAPESANNAVVASSMVPLLSLGIPGNSVSALFIAALMIHGMMPGPLLFIEHADIAWLIILAFVVANLVMGPIAFGLVRTLTGMVYRLPKELLIPTIGLLCLTGAYSDENSMFGIWVALAAGVVGYAFRKLAIPQAPIILALVLGRGIEDNLSNALNMAHGDWLVFVDVAGHPISALLMACSALFIIGPPLGGLRRRLNARHGIGEASA